MVKTYFLKILIISLMITGCSLIDNDKMPITSSSPEAVKLYERGCALADNYRNTESFQLLQQAIAEDPEFAMAYLVLAYTDHSPKSFLDNLNLAIKYIDKVSEGERLWILGVEAGSKGLVNDQREYFEKLAGMYPKDLKVLFLLGNFLFGQQECDAAIQHYKKIVALDSEFSPVYNMLGYSYRFLQNYTEAENNFKIYIELIPNDPNPYDSYAELLMKMGRFDESIDNYKKALSVNPYFTYSHIGIATNLNFKGKHIEARNQLHKMFETAKNDNHKRTALFAMAVSYVDEGNYQSALKVLFKSQKISEENNDSVAIAYDYINLGTILFEFGKIDKSSEYFTKARELIEQSNLNESIKETTHRNSLYYQARVSLYRGNIDEAKASADKYFKEASDAQNPGQIRIAHQLFGIIALEEKKFDTALVELRQANQQNPYNIYRIAEAYKGLNDLQTAKGFYQKVVGFNALNSMNYAFIRIRAQEIISDMEI